MKKLVVIIMLACMVAVQALAGIGAVVVGKAVGKAMADRSAPGPADLVELGAFGAGVAATAREVRKVKMICL